MVLDGIVVGLVDWDGCVNNVGLDRLFVDDWLDSLVDVVVHMLAANSRVHALAMRSILYDLLVLEPALTFNEGPLGVLMVTIIEFSVLDRADVGSVLLGQNFAIVNGLDAAVEVVLVDLLVDGRVDLLVLVRLDGFVLYGWSYFLVDSSVMVARVGSEVFDCCFDFVHNDNM